jgi:tripartite-type tricarboxylate transporter receptor subunit TctC
MRHLTALASAAFAVAVATWSVPGASQSSFPARPVSMVVPYAPGGGHDSMARMVAEKLAVRLGQSVIVENRAGANGRIGAEIVARAAPDGHTILFASPAEIVIAPIAYERMPYDPMKDLAPVTLAGITPLVIVAHPSAGVKTLPELIARAKAEPGKLSFGTAGNASSQHLAGAWLNNLTGIDLEHVPYKGAAPATNDVLGGQIPFAIVGMAPVLPHIKAGKLVPVAVTTRERVKWAEDVPTAAETTGLKDFEVPHWMGVFAPGGTPPAIVAKLRDEIAAVLGTDEFKERMAKLGVDPVGNTPEEFRAFLLAETEKFRKMYALTGLPPQ